MSAFDQPHPSLLEQAESLYFERERQLLNWQYEQERARALNAAARKARVAFLKACTATPWDISDYERWLEAYVRSGKEIDSYSTGSYPRPLEDQPSPLYEETLRLSGITIGSLEEEYFSSPVIWHIAEPVSFDELPQLRADVTLRLHLNKEALASFDETQLLWLDRSSNLRLYLDGRWQEGRWIAEPYAWNTVVSVWAENLENLRVRAEQERA